HARRRTEELLQQRENMLGTIASCARRLLQAGDWGQTIDDVLRELGQAVRASRVYVVRTGETDRPAEGRGTAAWRAPGVGPWTGDARLEDVLAAPWPGL